MKPHTRTVHRIDGNWTYWARQTADPRADGSTVYTTFAGLTYGDEGGPSGCYGETRDAAEAAARWDQACRDYRVFGGLVPAEMFDNTNEW